MVLNAGIVPPFSVIMVVLALIQILDLFVSVQTIGQVMIVVKETFVKMIHVDHFRYASVQKMHIHVNIMPARVILAKTKDNVLKVELNILVNVKQDGLENYVRLKITVLVMLVKTMEPVSTETHPTIAFAQPTGSVNTANCMTFVI